MGWHRLPSVLDKVRTVMVPEEISPSREGNRRQVFIEHIAGHVAGEERLPRSPTRPSTSSVWGARRCAWIVWAAWVTTSWWTAVTTTRAGVSTARAASASGRRRGDPVMDVAVLQKTGVVRTSQGH
jgi:hypothetical protein